jgi:hypothetical protein
MLALQSPAHYFEDGAPGARPVLHGLSAGLRARAGWTLAAAPRARRPLLPAGLAGAPKIARECDTFVVTLATPGVQLEHLEVDLVGNRMVHVRVLHPFAIPPVRAGTARPRKMTSSTPAHEEKEASAAQTAADPADAQAAILSAAQTAADPADAQAPAAPENSVEAPSAAAASVAVDTASPYYEDGVIGAEAHVAPAAAAQAAAAQEDKDSQVQLVVVLDKSIALPQPVDEAGIACSYQDGLLRIVIPIAAPALDTENEEHTAELQQEVSVAAAQLALLEQQVKDQREKIRAAHAALRAAKAAAPEKRRSRRQPLRIVAAGTLGHTDAAAKGGDGAPGAVEV